MQRISILLFCAAALLGGGCSDDESAAYDSRLLTGTWQQTDFYWSNTEGNHHEEVTSVNAIVLTFRDDGTGTEKNGTYGSPQPFSWKAGRYLIFEYDDGDVSGYRVEALTSDRLELSLSGTDEDGRWMQRMVFEAVS